MPLIQGIDTKTATAAVDELAAKFEPEIDADLQHFAATFAESLVTSLGKLFAGRTLTFTIKLGE